VLYLDSSALIKHYIDEAGCDAMRARIASESALSAIPFSSVLTYAEIHSTFAKKARKGSLTGRELRRARTEFDSDWAFGISVIPLDAGVLASIRDSVSRFPLSGADAVHLASALWFRNTVQAAKTSAASLTFATSDLRLIDAALGYGFQVFNPEKV
jgi:predicted nucleic acid-binding protein